MVFVLVIVFVFVFVFLLVLVLVLVLVGFVFLFSLRFSFLVFVGVVDRRHISLKVTFLFSFVIMIVAVVRGDILLRRVCVVLFLVVSMISIFAFLRLVVGLSGDVVLVKHVLDIVGELLGLGRLDGLRRGSRRGGRRRGLGFIRVLDGTFKGKGDGEGFGFLLLLLEFLLTLFFLFLFLLEFLVERTGTSSGKGGRRRALFLLGDLDAATTDNALEDAGLLFLGLGQESLELGDLVTKVSELLLFGGELLLEVGDLDGESLAGGGELGNRLSILSGLGGEILDIRLEHLSLLVVLGHGLDIAVETVDEIGDVGGLFLSVADELLDFVVVVGDPLDLSDDLSKLSTTSFEGDTLARDPLAEFFGLLLRHLGRVLELLQLLLESGVVLLQPLEFLFDGSL
mmetsp:Transcript_16219/g.26557  ORF Transcript_16219/g.26557 Transcript_16219/m.26557 type:complete len:398 (+) Transcript_16219:453-1646(+)